MKLRNKKTGEIREARIVGEHLQLWVKVLDDWVDYDDIDYLAHYWERYEEPKEWWYIDIHGPHKVTNNDEYYQQVKAASKEIGNYFETKEEAEKAVEKLKALANLRKRGLKFNGWDSADRGLVGEFEIYCDAVNLDGIEQELELVFGREEI